MNPVDVDASVGSFARVVNGVRETRMRGRSRVRESIHDDPKGSFGGATQ